MAKQSTDCVTCGGKTDGTPSGTMRHYKTGRHMAAVEAQNTPSVGEQLAEAAARVLGMEKPSSEKRAEAAVDAASTADLDGLRKQLKRREYSYQWRLKFAPERAEDYLAKKLQPLRDRVKEVEGK